MFSTITHPWKENWNATVMLFKLIVRQQIYIYGKWNDHFKLYTKHLKCVSQHFDNELKGRLQTEGRNGNIHKTVTNWQLFQTLSIMWLIPTFNTHTAFTNNHLQQEEKEDEKNPNCWAKVVSKSMSIDWID